MNLNKLLQIFYDKSCRKVYVKNLSPNDNSKNQVYLGGNFEVINILPIKEVVSVEAGEWKRIRFKSKIDFYWLNQDGLLSPAPDAQLIMYPKYPEVRFSGFLKGCTDSPSELMTSRLEGRLLFLGVTDSGQVIGHVVSPDSSIANEFNSKQNLPTAGVFKELTLRNGSLELNSKAKLLFELKRIHALGWIDSKRFNSIRNILPCSSSNCGGYTLEAELGITPNGYSEPDFLGWEVKQFSAKSFTKWQSEVITLMTPEPTNGFYVESGVESFIRKYGYDDKLGRESRMNFGGVHKFGTIHNNTSLKLIIDGFEMSSGKIVNTNGFVGLIDRKDNIAASWSFSSLLKHWNTKHANACYVPSMNRKNRQLYNFSGQQYFYGNNIMLGTGTDFSLVLKQIAAGNLYYDPGIKLELAIAGIRKQSIKRRSQFRIKSGFVPLLYKSNEVVDVYSS